MNLLKLLLVSGLSLGLLTACGENTSDGAIAAEEQASRIEEAEQQTEAEREAEEQAHREEEERQQAEAEREAEEQARQQAEAEREAKEQARREEEARQQAEAEREAKEQARREEEAQQRAEVERAAEEQEQQQSQANVNVTQATVRRAIDGDTIELSDGRRVRLIGVDSPERGESGFEAATNFTASRVEGRTVWLEIDGPSTDRFDRLRRYVWLEKPTDTRDEAQIRSKMLNAQLVANGHARAASINNPRNYSLFRSLR